MADIARWLQGLGLGKYADAFAENDVDLDVLPTLSEADLKELGLSLGHRRKLQAALGDLAEPARAEPLAPKAPKAEAERRQLTVMFCDLVGSTALSQRLDPEDFREIIRAFQEACTKAVRKRGGYVAKHLGDGLLAYFGYPQAQEDDAERAVRAALSIVEAVSSLKAPKALQVRAGLETGLVVVGEMVGEGMSQKGEISGETPNLAARLQQFAEPGGVVVGPTARRVLGGAFSFEDLGPQTLKGIAEPVAAARVVGEVRAQSRFEARHRGSLTRFVGRDIEITALNHLWEEAKAGDGQVVLISGEPGIGKSRLTQELRGRIKAEPHTRLGYQCSPHHTNSALYPVIRQLSFAAGIEPDEPVETKLDKLEELIGAGTNEVSSVAPLFADLLSIPADGRYSPLNYTQLRRREETNKAIVGQLDGLTAERPVLMIWEDVHWIDPTTQELLDLAVDRAADLPLLVVITFRPEYVAPWIGTAHVTNLTLSRLNRRLSAEITANVARTRRLPDSVVEDIVAKTEGVPLFVEELTKTVLESGPCEPDRAGVSALQVPATLKDSLAARLDRLGSARDLAQVGAVIGRTFSHELLAAVADIDAEALAGALDKLVGAELIFQRGNPPEAQYTFKHALIQDAAYESLLKSRRRSLHASVAETLSETSPEIADVQPELLAHHYAEAGQVERAVDYWYRAGQRALERSASEEAISHTGRGIALIGDLEQGERRMRAELALQTTLATAYFHQAPSAAETAEAFHRARQLANLVKDKEAAFPVYLGLHAFHFTRGEFHLSSEIAANSLALSRKLPAAQPLIFSLYVSGLSSWFLGNLTESTRWLEEAVRVAEQERPDPVGAQYGEEPTVTCRCNLSVISALLGHPDRAMSLARQALDQARVLDHVNSLLYALHTLSIIHRLLRRWDALLESVGGLLNISEEQRLPLWQPWARCLLGLAQAETGDLEAGQEALASGTSASLAQGAVFAPWHFTALAEVFGMRGFHEKAFEALDQAMAYAEKTNERWWLPEIHRLRGRMQKSVVAPTNAEISYREALAAAREREARWLELRAAIDLARLWRDQGKTAEARDLLAPIYGWFTEGFDTPDLKEAKALLEELG